MESLTRKDQYLFRFQILDDLGLSDTVVASNGNQAISDAMAIVESVVSALPLREGETIDDLMPQNLEMRMRRQIQPIGSFFGGVVPFEMFLKK